MLLGLLRLYQFGGVYGVLFGVSGCCCGLFRLVEVVGGGTVEVGLQKKPNREVMRRNCSQLQSHPDRMKL